MVHREADIVLNLNMYSQENCVGKFCHLFLKIKMSLEKLKKYLPEVSGVYYHKEGRLFILWG